MYKKQRMGIKVILAILLILTLSTTVFAESIKVVINNEPLVVPVAPVIEEGRTLVPLRAIFEALNLNVDWNGTTKTVTGTSADKTIILQIDNKLATINGTQVEMDVPGRIVGGSTLVPVRFIAESLGADVQWNNETRTVLINSDLVVAKLPVLAPEIKVAEPVAKPAPVIINKSAGLVGPVGNPATVQYIGSLKSDKYHFPKYKHNGQILDKNLIYFESKEHAIANGYKPCGICFK